MVRDLVDCVVVVDEQEIVGAMRLIMERMKVRGAVCVYLCVGVGWGLFRPFPVGIQPHNGA